VNGTYGSAEQPFLLSPKNNEPSQIKFLKESYEIRIGQLLDMLKNLASKMTSMNTTECINEIVFMEKERIQNFLYLVQIYSEIQLKILKSL